MEEDKDNDSGADDNEGPIYRAVLSNLDTYGFGTGKFKPRKERVIDQYVQKGDKRKRLPKKIKPLSYMWSSLKIMREMIVEDAIAVEEILNHIDYLIHIADIADKYKWEKVLLYDQVYRENQYNLGFPWGVENKLFKETYLLDLHEIKQEEKIAETEMRTKSTTVDGIIKQEVKTDEAVDGAVDNNEGNEESDAETIIENLPSSPPKDPTPSPPPKEDFDIADVDISADLHRHFKKRTMFSCNVCNETFRTKYQLTNHLKSHDKKEKDVEKIKTSIKKQPSRRKGPPKRKLKQENEQKDKVKTKPLDDRKNLQNYEDDVKDEDSSVGVKKEYECEQCHKVYQERKLFLRHTYTHKRRHKCSYCDKIFISTSHLRNHERIHTGEKPYECEFCGKKFRQAGSYQTHKSIHTGDKKHICQLCPKKCATAQQLKYHLLQHTGEKPYMCDICSKSYREQGALKDHMKTHIGVKPFKCDYCEKAYYRNTDLRKHIMIHTAEKPQQCDICGFTCRLVGQLRTHMRSHTGERPYKCEECGKGFTQQGALARHKMVHTGERPHKCKMCDKAFGDKTTLNKHMFVHTRERPHACTVCSQAFPWSHMLKKHMQTHLNAKKSGSYPLQHLVGSNLKLQPQTVVAKLEHEQQHHQQFEQQQMQQQQQRQEEQETTYTTLRSASHSPQVHQATALTSQMQQSFQPTPHTAAESLMAHLQSIVCVEPVSNTQQQHLASVTQMQNVQLHATPMENAQPHIIAHVESSATGPQQNTSIVDVTSSLQGHISQIQRLQDTQSPYNDQGGQHVIQQTGSTVQLNPQLFLNYPLIYSSKERSDNE